MVYHQQKEHHMTNPYIKQKVAWAILYRGIAVHDFAKRPNVDQVVDALNKAPSATVAEMSHEMFWEDVKVEKVEAPELTHHARSLLAWLEARAEFIYNEARIAPLTDALYSFYSDTDFMDVQEFYAVMELYLREKQVN
jgi:hypothetical protein